MMKQIFSPNVLFVVNKRRFDQEVILMCGTVAAIMSNQQLY